MRVPIVMLSGAAGSGKDTVAGFMVKNHDAISLAQADPMKRLVMKLFGFTEEQLWGPSELRNQPSAIPEWSESGAEHWGTLIGRFHKFAGAWLGEVLPVGANVTKAHGELYHWLENWGAGVPRIETPRRILQTLGTEWGRAFARDMWIGIALETARKLLGGGWGYRRERGLFYNETAESPPNLVVITDGRFRNEILAVRASGGATIKIATPGAGLSEAAAAHSSETEQNGIPVSWFDVVLDNFKEDGLEGLEPVIGWIIECVLPRTPHKCRTLDSYLLPHAMWRPGRSVRHG